MKKNKSYIIGNNSALQKVRLDLSFRLCQKSISSLRAPEGREAISLDIVRDCFVGTSCLLAMTHLDI